MIQELWKDVKGYEGLYKVSNLGRVRSIERYVRSDRNPKTGLRLIKPKILKAWDNGNGYMVVTISVNKKRKNKYVHRLVAEAFIPNPENKPQVNHIDNNRSNNIISNLEWCTASENSIHMMNQGRGKNQFVKKYKVAKD